MLRLLANREQNKKNFVKIVESKTGCCGSEKEECQYLYSDSDLQEITEITIGDDTYNLPDNILEEYEAMDDGSAEKVKFTRQVVLPWFWEEAGLFEDGISTTITNDGQAISIESEVEIILNSVDPDTVQCKRISFCDYCFSVESWDDSEDTLTVGGDDKTPVAEVTYPDGRDDLETAFQTALDDAEEIVVIDDTANSSFTVVITYPEGTQLTVNNDPVPCCHTEQGWAE